MGCNDEDRFVIVFKGNLYFAETVWTVECYCLLLLLLWLRNALEEYNFDK